MLKVLIGYTAADQKIASILRIAYMDDEGNIVDGNGIDFECPQCRGIANELVVPLKKIAEGYPDINSGPRDYPNVVVIGQNDGDACISDGNNKVIINRDDVHVLAGWLEAVRLLHLKHGSFPPL